MADPAELIRSLRSAVVRMERTDKSHYTYEMRVAEVEAVEAALLAALTPQPSAEDAAVLDAFENAIGSRRTSFQQEDIEAAQDWYEEARAACLTRMAGKVPMGWKLVPVEPTPEMSAFTTTGVHHPLAERIYAAMLAAAPEALR